MPAEDLTPEELQEAEEWLVVAVAEAFLEPDDPIEFDDYPEAEAERNGFD